MKLALAQMNIAWENNQENLAAAAELAGKASASGCDALVFPEMFTTGFTMNVRNIRREDDGETARTLSRLAARFRIHIIAGYQALSEIDGRPRNLAVVFDREGARVATYAKMHPFSLAQEDRFYAAGDRPVTFPLCDMRAGIFICYDLRFPEVFREIAREVQAVFVIANWPESRKDHWLTLLKARAIENQCFVIGVNRVGRDGNGLDYGGGSTVWDPQGGLICSAGEKEDLAVCEILPDFVIEVRTRFPFLQDMRTDS